MSNGRNFDKVKMITFEKTIFSFGEMVAKNGSAVIVKILKLP